MASYLVDYENVQGGGLDGLSRLAEVDKVYIFYSDNADKLTFNLHKRLNETPAKVEYVRVEVGHKNALDFQLATYVGYLVANDASEHYFLVTKDAGFEAIARFWRSHDVSVQLASNLTGRSKEAIEDDMAAQVRELIGDTEEIITVVAYIQKYKTKSGINNALGKRYGSQRAGEIYKAIKPLITDKKGTDNGTKRGNGTSGKKAAAKNGNGTQAKKTTAKNGNGTQAKKAAAKKTGDTQAKKATAKNGNGTQAKKTAAKKTGDTQAKKTTSKNGDGTQAKKTTAKNGDGTQGKGTTASRPGGNSSGIR